MSDFEQEWIRRARAGDEKALHDLFRHYEQPLLRYLRRMLRSHADAEDAVQRTFVQAYRHLGRYREEGRFRPWLYRIAHREGLRIVRRRRPHEGEEALARTPAPGRSPADAAGTADERERLRALVAALPEAQREIVAMRIDGGLTFREIAEALDQPLGTVLTRMRRATQALQEGMSDAR